MQIWAGAFRSEEVGWWGEAPTCWELEGGLRLCGTGSHHEQHKAIVGRGWDAGAGGV